MSFISRFALVGVAGSLLLGVAGCGSDDNKSSSVKPLAEVTDASNGKTTAVTLAPGFVKALGTLKLTPAPIGDAKISSSGVASFPITGGHVKYYKPGSVSPFVQGELDHDGSGLSLTSAGGKKVELKDFVIDPGKSVLTGKVYVDGKEAVKSAPLFFLDGRTLKPLRTSGSDAILQGTTVKLKQEAADLLNKTFGTQALAGGFKIGVAKITLATK